MRTHNVNLQTVGGCEDPAAVDDHSSAEPEVEKLGADGDMPGPRERHDVHAAEDPRAEVDRRQRGQTTGGQRQRRAQIHPGALSGAQAGHERLDAGDSARA